MRKLILIAGVVAAFAGNSLAVSFKNVPNGVWNTGISTGNVLLAGGAVDSNYALIQIPAGCVGTNPNCQEDGTPGNAFGPATYVVLGPNGQYPLNGTAWVLSNDTVNGPNSSQWIGPRANQNTPCQGGPANCPYIPGIPTDYRGHEVFSSNNEADFYVYRMVFNLTVLGLDPAGAAISLSWLSDNRGVPDGNPLHNSHIRMCGIGAASDPVCAPATMVPGSTNAGQGSSTMTTVNITSGFTTGLMALDFIVYNAVVGAGQLNPSGMRVLINTADAPVIIPEPSTVSLLGLALLGLGLYARRKL